MKQFPLLAGAIASVVAFVPTQTLYAGVIISQPFNNGVAEVTSDVEEGTYAADNFTAPDNVSAGTEVTVTWWGRYFSDTVDPVVEFSMLLYGNNVVDSTPATSELIMDISLMPTVVSSVGMGDATVYELNAQFNLSDALMKDSVYWLSIIDIDDNDPEWLWVEGDASPTSVGDIAISQNEGVSWMNFNSPDRLAFELSTLNVTAVPEPSSLALLGMGAFGLMGYGWRRKKRVAADG